MDFSLYVCISSHILRNEVIRVPQTKDDLFEILNDYNRKYPISKRSLILRLQVTWTLDTILTHYSILVGSFLTSTSTSHTIAEDPAKQADYFLPA